VVAAGLLTWAVALAPGMANAAVSSLPPATPQLGTSGTDGTVEQVRQIVQCGGTMYAVGLFSQVKNGNSTALIARNNAFAFSATSPYRVTNWNPNINGQVNSAACAPDGDVILAGSFTQAGTTAVKNLVKVNGTTGVVNPAFLWTLNGTTSPAGLLNHVEVVQGHLLVGGNFTAPKASYLASVSPLTGRYDNYVLPAISGTYVYTGVKSNTTKIYNMIVRAPQASDPNEDAILMTGVFTSVAGQHHEQIFRLNMPVGGTATVSAWQPADLYTHCATVEPFYAQDAAWSPDGSKIYIANTGYKPFDRSNRLAPAGPCDSVIGYNAEPQVEIAAGLPTGGGRLWVNYTGCDSLYSIAADASTVFIAGHERFIDNSNECDRNNTAPGRAQPGLGEVDPVTGLSQAGPSRGRGLGADDLLRTTAGLWIASDNQANTSTCAGKSAHMGLCFLPN
jgi:hypothetical protein